MVTFDIGGKVIGTPQPCSSNPFTAVSVLGATSATDPSVVNLSQLLLTLGPIVNNVIQIPQPLPAGFNGSLVPAFNDPNFDTDVQPALPTGTTLVSNAAATAHLATSFKTLSVTIVNSGIVTSTPPGINCTAAGTCSYSFVAGTAVTLTTTGSGFIGWSNGTGSASCTGAGTCPVTVNADSGVTATFPVAPPPPTLTISKAGNGTGTVNCSVNGGAFGACAASYPHGTALSLQGVADNGSTFTGWSLGTGNIGCTGTSNCSVTLTADSAVTATFTLIGTQVSMTANTATTTGGAGTVACSTVGQNGPFGPCATSYNAGTTLWLQATPNNVSNFTGWTGLTGSATCQALTSPFCTFTLNLNSMITANFNRPTVSVNVVGPGTVTSNPAGINCPGTCAAIFNANSSVVLSTSSAGFSGWSAGKGSANCSGTGTCTIPTPPLPLPLVDSSITASFSQGGPHRLGGYSIRTTQEERLGMSIRPILARRRPLLRPADSTSTRLLRGRGIPRTSPTRTFSMCI